MKKIGWTVTLATGALLTAGCRPTGPEPRESIPARRPTPQVVAPLSGDELTGAPTAGTGILEDRTGQSGQGVEGESEADWLGSFAPQSSEGRVLVAIGRAVWNSVSGAAREQP